MWEEDISGYEPEGEQPAEYGVPEKPEVPLPAAQSQPFPQMVPLPNMVPVMDLYQAARARAVADQQLSRLFNPEYYI